MRHKFSLLVAVICMYSLAGCGGLLLGGGYWQNTLSSTQASGVGSDSLNLMDDLNVEVAEPSLDFNFLLGGHSSQRLRISYWNMHAEGDRPGNGTNSDIAFAGVTFPGTEDLASIMDIEAAGLLWEPSLIKTNYFRFRPILGLSLMNFAISIEETNGTQSVSVKLPGADGPLSSVGLDMVPIPVAGASLEIAMSPKLFFFAQAQLFDTAVAQEALAGVVEDLSATFQDGIAGFVYTPASKLHLTLGYKYFKAEYTYSDDVSDSVISGPYAGLSFVFGGR